MVLQPLSLQYLEFQVFKGLSYSGRYGPFNFIIVQQADFILYLNIHQLQLQQSMNRSEISNDFNFQNQLDISQTRKEKTQNFFTREGFAFEDFMNIGDRTMKSDKFESKLQPSNSGISKKEVDEPLPSNFFDELSQYSTKRKFTKEQIITSSMNPKTLIRADTTPKFSQKVQTSKSIALPQKQKQFTLRRADIIQQQNAQKNLKNPSNFMNDAFKKKQPFSQQEQEYKCVQSQILFYQQQMERMVYESKRMEEETQNLIISFSKESHEEEIAQNTREIKEINKQIEEQRQLEIQLTKMVHQLQQQYEEIVHSIKTTNFPRPVIVKDEAKLIIDDINTLKAEFQALQRDDGSLNLSSTLLQIPGNNAPSTPFSTLKQKKSSETGKQRVNQIYEQNKVSEDPRFLHNLKMACLKPEWCLYSNSEIQVNVSYRDAPKIVVRLGNKLNQDLRKFTLKQNQSSRLEGQVIASHSYLQHIFEVDAAILSELFLKLELSYETNASKRQICIFVPVGLTNFGEFSPITVKQFQNDAGKDPFSCCGGFRPMDKKIISNLAQTTIYMPNLIVDPVQQICFGLFITPFDDCELVVIKQKGEMLSILTKNQNWPLVRLLQFILTV